MEIDQQLKERLVGATVLIVAGIVIIPLLLDGPQTSQPVRVGLELPAAQAERQTHTIRLDVPASQPASQASGAIERPAPTPVAATPPATLPAGEPPPEPATEPVATARPSEPATQPVATERPSKTPAARQTRTAEQREPASPPATPPDVASESPPQSSSGGWAVQIGSFSQTGNVERINRELGAAGFDSFSTRIVSGGRTLHRVRVGPVADRSAAEALARRLDAAGFKGRVVSNED